MLLFSVPGDLIGMNQLVKQSRLADGRWKGLLVVFSWLVHSKCQCEDVVRESQAFEASVKNGKERRLRWAVDRMCVRMMVGNIESLPLVEYELRYFK